MRTKIKLRATILVTIISYLVFSSELLVAQSVPVNHLIVPSTTSVIPFRWLGDTFNSIPEKHAYMLIEVRVKNCPRKFYMQFDTGSPYSLLYKNKIDAIGAKYPGSVESDIIDEILNGFSFTVGKTPVIATEIIVKQFDSSDIDWKNNNGVEIIGTLGTDLIDGKVAIIDYPKCELIISESIPEKLMRHILLTDFMYVNRRILLPSKIKDRKTILYFDTGSSMFELLTDKETSYQLAAPGAKLIQYESQSWDKTLTANTLASNDSIEFADIRIPIRATTYMEGVADSQIELMRKIGIGGMTGNKIFLDHVLILDTRNQKFGLKGSR